MTDDAGRAYSRNYNRMGTCKVCGESVMWWMTDHGNRVPLDPLPVIDLADHIDEPHHLYAPRNATIAGPIGDTKLYRVHNNGSCIRLLRDR